jgi:hypothetical protein
VYALVESHPPLCGSASQTFGSSTHSNLAGREASAEGSHATLRPGQTRTDLGSESIGEKRFKGDTEEQYEVDKRKRDVRKRND